MQIVDNWLQDMPQQFLGKARIEALIEAFSKQLQELDAVYNDLNNLTDLETATGNNLDMVGDIVALSRKEAGELAGHTDEDPLLPDDMYRQFLKYKCLANTNECTYYDLMKGLEILWNVSPVYYVEDSNYPATIMLTLPFSEHLGETIRVGEVPMVKPAGVRIEFEFLTKVEVETTVSMNIKVYRTLICGTFVCGKRSLGEVTE